MSSSLVRVLSAVVLAVAVGCSSAGDSGDGGRTAAPDLVPATSDGAGPTVDASGPGADGPGVASDAIAAAPDATGVPGDALLAPADTALAPADATLAPADGGAGKADATGPSLDALAPNPDAKLAPADAALAPPDGAKPALDAAGPPVDLAAPDLHAPDDFGPADLAAAPDAQPAADASLAPDLAQPATQPPTAHLVVTPKRLPHGGGKATLVLDGTASTGGQLGYQWTPSRGAFVDGTNAASAVAHVEVTGGLALGVTLRVTNPSGVDQAAVVVPVNQPPVAAFVAGLQTVPLLAAATVDASPSSDPDGDPLAFSFQLLSAPAGSKAALAPAGAKAALAPDRAGSYVVDVAVSDGLDTTHAQATLYAAPVDVTPPTAQLGVAPQIAAVGDTITVTVLATDDTGVASVVLAVEGQKLPLNGNTATFVPMAPGLYHVTLDVTDTSGNRAQDAADVFVHDPKAVDAGNKLMVAIAAPADGSELTKPVDVTGTVVGPNLVGWTLELRARHAGEKVPTPWRRIGAGKSALMGGKLATLDTTLLADDTYEVRLVAWDGFAHGAEARAGYVVSGRRKVGAMSVSFVDAVVQSGPVPFQLVRSYLSIDHTTTDFGVGWRLHTAAAHVETTAIPGEGWAAACGFFGGSTVTPLESHVVTIRLGAETYRFNFAPDVVGCFGTVAAKARFVALPGTTGALVPDGDADLSYLPQTHSLNLGLLGSGEVYDPPGYTLTAKDGFQVHFGKGGAVDTITDPAGRVVAIDATGIHRGAAYDVRYTRDGAGRITKLELPDGSSRAYAYDGNGDLVTSTDFEGGKTVYSYDAGHLLLAIVTASGRPAQRNEYDVDGRLVAVVDADGHRVEVKHMNGGKQEVVTDRLGRTWIVDYDDAGHVVKSTDPKGRAVSATWDAGGRLKSRTDELGHTWSYTWSTDGKLTGSKDPLGRGWTWGYEPGGRVTSIVDPAGHKATFAYDSKGRLTGSVGLDGGTRSYGYDGAGNRNLVVDALGQKHVFGFDGDGHAVSWTDPGGATATYAFGKTGLATSKSWSYDSGAGMRPAKATQTYAHDGSLRSVTSAEGGTRTLKYNAEGNPAGFADGIGVATTIEYGSSGRARAVRLASGGALTVLRDANDQVVGTTSTSGESVARTLDEHGRPVKVVDSLGEVTSTTYDDAGRPTAVSRGGATTTLEHDAAGQLTAFVRPGGARTELGYDALGHLVTRKDALGRTFTRKLDAAGRELSLTGPDGKLRRAATYDAGGRLQSAADALGHATKWGYGPYGVTSVTDALGHTATLARNEAGAVVRVTDGSGKATKLEVDSKGRVLTRTLPSGASETTMYDADGKPALHVGFTGAKTAFSYDGAGRLVKRAADDGTFVTYGYDAQGRVGKITTPDGVTSIGYDARGEITSVVEPDGRAVDYAWSGGRVVAVTTPSGTTSYGRDALGRVVKVTDPGGAVLLASYDALDRRTTLGYPNGVTVSYGYDAASGLVSSIAAARGKVALWSEAYTRDASGRVVRVDEGSGRVRTFTYDDAGHLTSETVKDGADSATTSYTYDAASNRATRTDAGGTATYTYDADQRLLSDGTYTYAYDAGGRLAKRTGGGETLTYGWDGLGRLAQVARQGKSGPALVTYHYDALGALARRDVDGKPVRYLNDHSGELAVVLEETDAKGQVARNLYRPGEARPDPWGRVAGGVATYPVLDALGSVRLVADDAGAALGELRYDAFGREGSQPSLPELPSRFAGERFDAATGLYDLRARRYDPSTGRFLSRDAVPFDERDPASFNAYHYASGDPVNAVDPSGRQDLIEYVVTLAEEEKLADEISTLFFAAFAGGGIGAGLRFDNADAHISTSTLSYTIGRSSVEMDDLTFLGGPGGEAGAHGGGGGGEASYVVVDLVDFPPLVGAILSIHLTKDLGEGWGWNMPNEYFYDGLSIWAKIEFEVGGGVGITEGGVGMGATWRYMFMINAAFDDPGKLSPVRAHRSPGGPVSALTADYGGAVTVGSIGETPVVSGSIGFGRHTLLSPEIAACVKGAFGEQAKEKCAPPGAEH